MYAAVRRADVATARQLLKQAIGRLLDVQELATRGRTVEHPSIVPLCKAVLQARAAMLELEREVAQASHA